MTEYWFLYVNITILYIRFLSPFQLNYAIDSAVKPKLFMKRLKFIQELEKTITLEMFIYPKLVEILNMLRSCNFKIAN